MKTIFIPENLDVDKLLSDNPPPIENFKKDKLLILLSQIAAFTTNVKDLNTWDGYSRLQARILQSIVHDYNKYFEYLEQKGVVEIDRSYQVGARSKGYKFAEEYQCRLRTKQIESYKEVKVREKTKKIKCIDEKLKVLERRYLTKWLEPKYLSIDYERALEYIKEQFDPYKHEGRTNFRALKKYNCYYICITKIYMGEIYASVDNTSNRLHTNLTGLKKELRRFIRFKGKKLVSWDIKNSQPYLSIALLQQSFYVQKSKLNYHKIALQSKSPISPKASAAATIMLEKINNSTNKLDNTQAYIDKVVQGELYEYLLGVIKEYDLCFATNRDETKLSILKGYFSDNRFFGQPDKDAAMKQLFYMLFPEVYDLFKIIKKGEKNKLAILLQRIESYLVIEVICKRIAKHNKEIPLYTIHDSIATTEEYLDIVHDIMMESLKEYIGYYPFLKDEPWY